MIVIKQYGASWCSPCQTLKPIMREIVSQNPSVSYQYIDVDQNPSDAQTNGVRSVPVVIVMRNGIETSRIVGLQPKSVYEQALR